MVAFETQAPELFKVFFETVSSLSVFIFGNSNDDSLIYLVVYLRELRSDGSTGNSFDHSLKNKAVKGEDCIPVESAEYTNRPECGCLDEQIIFIYLEF